MTETELKTNDKAGLTGAAEKPTAGSLAVTVVAETQPLVAEVELKPLAIPRQLPLSGDAELAEPAVGFWGRHRLFIMTVILPMTIGAVFLLFVFTPRFSSTANFVVKSTQNQSQAALSSLAQDALGTPVISAESYAISAYLTSRDIVDRLAKDDNLRAILSRPQGDFVFHYPTFWLPDNNEFLYRRFQWMASSYVDDTTGISTVEVNAFNAEDAQKLARTMLGYAEALVDGMNERMYRDQLASAERFVADAQKDVDAIEAELKAFRNVSGSVDPTLVAQSKLQVIEGLSTQLAQVEATIAQQVVLARGSPTIEALRAQAQSYRDEIEKRKMEIAGASGSEAIKLETYDQLSLRRTLAAQALSDAVIQRDQARQTAEQQHLYIQLISQPNLARDWARYPQASLDLLALLAVCLAVFQVLRKLRDFAAEHRP